MSLFSKHVLPLALLSTVVLPALGQNAVFDPPAEERVVDKPKVDDSKLVQISKQDKVWIDQKNKLVIVEGKIALDKGQLEMFACVTGTKEHESVVAVDGRAYIVHTALLAVGARSGHPVKFDPVYQVATGDKIEVTVEWTDKDGKTHKVRAQDMVRNTKTQKPLKHDWVFGGSGFWVDADGKQRYMAEGGELICVSNFSTATMDLQIRSSQVNESLLYEALSEKIPPRDTKVKLILKPMKDPAKNDAQTEEASEEATDS